MLSLCSNRVVVDICLGKAYVFHSNRRRRDCWRLFRSQGYRMGRSHLLFSFFLGRTYYGTFNRPTYALGFSRRVLIGSSSLRPTTSWGVGSWGIVAFSRRSSRALTCADAALHKKTARGCLYVHFTAIDWGLSKEIGCIGKCMRPTAIEAVPDRRGKQEAGRNLGYSGAIRIHQP